jgi:hypothetical protein
MDHLLKISLTELRTKSQPYTLVSICRNGKKKNKAILLHTNFLKILRTVLYPPPEPVKIEQEPIEFKNAATFFQFPKASVGYQKSTKKTRIKMLF